MHDADYRASRPSCTSSLEAIKDESLAEEAAKIEKTASRSASESRAAIKGAIEQRYTLPA